MGIKTSRGSVHNLNYHLIWVTKYRESIFNTENKVNDMKEILKTLAGMKDIEIQSIEVMPDHIHLLVSSAPKVSVSEMVKVLKGASARNWFKEHPETKELLWGGHLWSDSYFAGTLGDMSKDIVANYINNQATEYNMGRKRKNKRF